MDFNRNHYFMIGLVVLFLGIQVKCVDAYVLTDEAAQFISKNIRRQQSTPAEMMSRPFAAAASFTGAPPSSRSINPPQWLGWALMSVGAVLVLHSLAMTKPG